MTPNLVLVVLLLRFQDYSLIISNNNLFVWIDLLTVSETSNEPPQDEITSINSPRNLALEATFINHNFSQQVLRMVWFIVFKKYILPSTTC